MDPEYTRLAESESFTIRSRVSGSFRPAHPGTFIAAVTNLSEVDTICCRQEHARSMKNEVQRSFEVGVLFDNAQNYEQASSVLSAVVCKGVANSLHSK